jgi:glycine cleavage system transcriptional repressor
MNKSIVLSIVGKDRPGIVAAITRILFEHGCNIEDSSMTILENEFAMILIVNVPAPLSIETLAGDLHSVEKSLSLSIFIKSLTKEETQRAKPQETVPISISVYGSDRPGIVYNVSKLLADKNINITDLNTKVISPKREPVYVMILEAAVPAALNLEILVEELHELGRKLSVDITVNKIDDIPL